MKLIPRILPGLLLPLALALPSVAQETTTFSVTAPTGQAKDSLYVVPTENVVFYQPSANVLQGEERDVKDNRDNAQTFQLSTDTIIDKLFITFESAPLGADQATFHFLSLSAHEELSSAVILSSVTFSSADLGMAAGTLIFDVPDISASSGSVFGIRFDTVKGSNTVFKWKGATTSFEGIRYENGSPITTAPEYFTIGVVAAIPEPSTYAMIFGALALVGAVVRRRMKR